MLPVILSNTPAGASTKQFLHYAQEIKTGPFQRWDYGIPKNLIKYGRILPPKYNTHDITAPVALIYGANDLLASEQDIYKLKEELPYPVIMYRVKDKKFNHLDFLWAKDNNELLYPIIFKMLDRF